MAVNVGTAVAYLDLNMTAFNTSLQQAKSALQTFQDEESSVGDKWMATGSVISNVGTRLTQNVTVPLANLGQSSLQYYADFESAITGIRKTVDDVDVTRAFDLDPSKPEDVAKAYDLLAEKIEDMAIETGISATELARVGEVSGQLGIEVGKEGSNLLNFIAVMAKLGVTTDLTSEDAALALARFINVADTTQGEVDKLGATIVDLGNNFATNEAEIVYMSQRLASAGTVAGLTSKEILALSTAISSAGIKTEAGASSMSTTLNNIEQIVQGTADNAEEKLQTLAQISGMSAEQFAETWNEKPIEALQAFFVGLKNVDTEGESMIVFLDELGMSSIRQGNLVRALALSCENLGEAVDTANRAWDEGTALETEWNKYASTTNQEIRRLQESWKAVKNELGELLLPVLKDLIAILRELIDWWNGLSDTTKQSIVHFLEFAAVLGPIVTIVGKLITIIGFIKNLGIASSIVNLTKVVGSFGIAFKTILTQSVALFGKLLSAVKVLGTGIVAVFKTILSVVGSVLKSILGLVQSFGSAVVNGVKAVVSAIPNIIQGIVTAIQNIIQGFISFLTSTAGGVVLVISGVITAVWNFVKMWQEGTDIIHGLLMTLGIALTAVGAIILGAPALVTAVIAAIVAAVAFLVLAIHEHWDDIKAWWTGKVVPWFKETGEKFKEGWQKFWQGVKDVFSKIWQSIKDAFHSAGEWLSNAVSKIGELFNKIGESIANGAKWVLDKLIEVKDTIFEMIGNVVELLTTLGKEIVAKAREAINNFTTAFKDAFHNFSEQFKNIFNGIVDLVLTLGKNLIDKGKEIGSSFINGILDKLKDTRTFIKEMFDTIINFAKEFLPKIFDLGKTIAGKIFDGFKEKIIEAIEWIKEKFQALSDWWNNLPVVKGVKGGVQNLFNNLKNLINGSHADGLDYVPFDGYIAELHRGERVLTAEENARYSSASSGNATTINFYSNERIDEYVAAKELRRTIKDIELGLV